MPDARTLLNTVSNCYHELRICGYELSEAWGVERWTHSVAVGGNPFPVPCPDGSVEEFEGCLSPSIYLQLSQQITLELSVSLHWREQEWMIDGDVARQDEGTDEFAWLWQAGPQRATDLESALRTLTRVTGELIEKARALTPPKAG